MLDHGVYLDCSICHLRPMTDADEDRVLELWNQDFVVGNLFMSKTSHETYRKYFEKYKADPNEWRFVIEDARHAFVGTTGYTRIDAETFSSGYFAMYPTQDPILPALNVLTGEWLWERMGFKKHVFTVNAANKKIKRYHQLLGNVYTGKSERKIGSDGRELVLEHWIGTVEGWPKIRAQFGSIAER